MRRKLLLSAVLAGVSLCMQALPITRSQARLVAQELVGIDDQSIDDDAVVSPYYIFSRGRARGYVIVSGDDSTAPILGYTEQGDYDADQAVEPLREMLATWADAIGRLQLQPQTTQRRLSVKARAIASYKQDWVDVSALCDTHWHQSSPYNDLAPLKNGERCMTGCVATAGSQVTYYFRKDNPSQLSYDTPTYGYGTPVTVSLPAGTPIEWSQMKKSGSGTAEQNMAVAKLMYALGTSAWLTYGDGDGLATSGHNYKMGEAMQGQFRLNYQHAEKSGYSQENWEKLIYSNLVSRRPMLYSGVHPDNGGHSVVLDGYQKSTGLYHFNFGWGGQGDGWYTVDDKTGMNGFNSYQDLIYNITPQLQNMTGTLEATMLYQRASTTVTATVKNNGTLDYSGYYIYTNTRPKLPSSSAVSDLKTVVESGKKATLSFQLTVTAADSVYVFLCGKNKQVLDTRLMVVRPTKARLQLDSIAVASSTDQVTVDGMTFPVVHNTRASVSVRLTNGEGGTYCQPTFRCFLEKYNETTKQWGRESALIYNSLTFDEGTTRDTTFVFDRLSPDACYRVFMDSTVVCSETSFMRVATDVPVVYFMSQTPDLDVAVNGREAVVTGHWDEMLFSEQAADARICSFDISQVTGLGVQPVAANPNALFYTAEGDETSMHFPNVVAGDVCQQLVIHSDADFKPSRPFTARQATMVLDNAQVGKWRGVLMPFALEVPYGMQMKVPESFSNNIVAHTAVRTVEAMKTVIYQADRAELHTLSWTDVAVGCDTVASLLDGQLIASTLAVPADASWMVLGESIGSPAYLPATEGSIVPAFSSYLVGATGTRVRVTTETLADSYYSSLALNISKCYEALAVHAEAPAEAVEALQAELKKAEDMFTYRQAAAAADIKTEDETLTDALRAFLQAAQTGIMAPQQTAEPSKNDRVEYFNLSGQRIEKPARGLVIEKRGQHIRKIFIR